MLKKAAKIIKLIPFFLLIICATPQISLAADRAKNPADVCVSGIMFDEDKPLAVINGQILSQGDRIEDIKIVKIGDSSVQFEYNGQVFIKELNEGCQEVKQPFYKKPVSHIHQNSREKEKMRGISSKWMMKLSSFMNMEIIEELKLKEFLGKILNYPYGMAIVIGAILLLLTIYAYIAVALQKIAKKTDIDNGWLAWIPIANLYLICMIAEKPWWWLLFLFIPYLNFIIMIILWAGIAKACNKPSWLGVLMVLPIVNLVVISYLAFKE